MADITLSNIAHSYSGRTESEEDYALKKMNLIWKNGGAYALLGPSGCGKTTLLNIISGLLQPTEGQVLFDQQDVTTLPTEQRNIAQIFQFPVIYDTMTVYQNLAFPLENRGRSKQEIEPRVQKLASMLGLTQDLQRKAQHLTADAKQKISLGRGLIRQSVNAILFDEPLTVIDPQLKWELRSQLKYLHKEFGFTMIYVTHDQTEALTFADEVVVMYEGKVVQVGTPEQLFERPEHTFVGYFIGSPGMNILSCDLQEEKLQIGKHTLELNRRYPSENRGKIEVGIRPEHLQLKAIASETDIPVTIRRIDDIGRHKIVRAVLDQQDIDIVSDAIPELQDGKAALDFNLAYTHLYCDGRRLEGELR